VREGRGWVITIVVVFLVTGCSGPVPATRPASGPAPVKIVLFGDSLAYQAAPYFDQLVEARGASVTNFVFGGTAVCDWLPEMRKVARAHPQAVVIAFSGDTFTSCMRGCPSESSSAVSRYCLDMSAAIVLFLDVGTRVFLEGTPISYGQSVAHDPHWDDLNRAFAALAAQHPRTVTYVDAGRAVEGPGGVFTWTLPCLATEPCTGPTLAGVRTNVVRSPDGGHFCLVSNGNAPGCGSYSSGAFRFASAMAGPVIKAFEQSTADDAPR
jgi:hypothetical protein